MNKLPSSADCLLFVWDDLSPAVEGRKSELRPVCSLVCLKIFARWVEKYFRIQCPAWCCLVVLLSSFTNRNRSVDWLHQFSWECKKCCEFQFLHKNNRETYAVKKTKTAPTSLTRTTDYTNPTSRCLILLDPTAQSSAWKQINSILKSLRDINLCSRQFVQYRRSMWELQLNKSKQKTH